MKACNDKGERIRPEPPHPVGDWESLSGNPVCKVMEWRVIKKVIWRYGQLVGDEE